ncbi:MAG TPA: hypothetical protein VLS27_04350 [Gammaproteobacteria bacterium]|nr:hypothetical protein [Gammaproteobacteria bacterium]
MTDHHISFETLNAYVDGELDTAAAAEVARAIAESSALAREVSALSRLRQAVAEGVETRSLSPPAPLSNTARGAAIAAGVALVMFIAGSFLVSVSSPGPGGDWLARAWAAHRGWSVENVAAQSRPVLPLRRYAQAVPGAYVPDLSASRLTLVHATLATATDERRMLLAGYRGTRGCKISLLVFPSPSPLVDSLSHFRDGSNEAYGWRVGALSYVIMSDGMDSERFKLLAESVRRTSREHLPLDTETRLALRQSRDASAPCTA